MIMKYKNKIIAIIPARSGSKGLKNKNIKLLNKKPLIAYTIEAALKSKLFNEVFVSTDSKKYAKIAKKYGASVPFLRSKLNSKDSSKTVDVVKETLERYKQSGLEFDAFCILQPTSPLRTIKDIKNAYKIFINKSTVATVSVTESDHPISYYNIMKSNNSLDGFISKKIINNRRQDFKKYYRVNGAIYFMYTKEYYINSNFYRKGSYAYIMNKNNSIDIDDIFDFKMAEALIKIKHEKT